ncbi:hypothetical protein [Roseateles sp.]|uniref:hypothetical protein n=1 Tax=Roseateles sp. TaxID=1971397 RepID=UPI002F42FEB0
MTKVPAQSGHAQLHVIPAIVQRHAEDASFYWSRHGDAMFATEHDWQSLQRMERLLDAHLEGLRVAQLESAQAPAFIGDVAWAASKTRLARWGTSDEAFVAGTLAMQALELGTTVWLEELQTLAQAQFESGRGDAIAIGLAGALRRRGDTLSEKLASHWWEQASPLWRRAALIAAHSLPTLRTSLIRDGLRQGADPAVIAEAARLAGSHGIAEAVPALQAVLNEPSSSLETRRVAAAAIGRLIGSAADGGAAWRQAEAVLLDAWITAPEELTDEELVVWLWRAAPATTVPAIERMLIEGNNDRRRWREALRAIRFQGDPRWLPVLLQCMAHQSQQDEVRRFFVEPSSNLARLAGDVFAHITGARIGHQRWREAPEAPDDAEDALDNPYVPASAKRDPDGALLWPDVEVLNREWPSLSSTLDPARRYLGGEAVTESTLLRVLGNAKASQQQRWQAALLLQLARGASPCFDVGAATPAQDRALAALGTSSWNW